MKRYTDLTADEQEAAIDKATNSLLAAIVEGAIRFNDDDNHNTLQAEIDAAIKDANANQTPWFETEYVRDAVGETLRSMGVCDAEDAFYPAPEEGIIRLP